MSYSTEGAEFGGFKSQIGISNNNNDLNASKWSYMASFTLRIPFHIKKMTVSANEPFKWNSSNEGAITLIELID